MKTIAIAILAMTACATETIPKEKTSAQDLCTVDDPDCGPPGSSPIDVRAATTEWVADSFPSGLILSISCFTTSGAGGGSQCHVTISQGSWTYSYGCALWAGSSTLDCGEE